MLRINKIRGLIKRFLVDEDGQDYVEYALLAAFIGLVAIASVNALQDAIAAAYADADASEQDLWRPPDPPSP